MKRYQYNIVNILILLVFAFILIFPFLFPDIINQWNDKFREMIRLK